PSVTGVQTCALPIFPLTGRASMRPGHGHAGAAFDRQGRRSGASSREHRTAPPTNLGFLVGATPPLSPHWTLSDQGWNAQQRRQRRSVVAEQRNAERRGARIEPPQQGQSKQRG